MKSLEEEVKRYSAYWNHDGAGRLGREVNRWRKGGGVVAEGETRKTQESSCLPDEKPPYYFQSLESNP